MLLRNVNWDRRDTCKFTVDLSNTKKRPIDQASMDPAMADLLPTSSLIPREHSQILWMLTRRKQLSPRTAPVPIDNSTIWEASVPKVYYKFMCECKTSSRNASLWSARGSACQQSHSKKFKRRSFMLYMCTTTEPFLSPRTLPVVYCIWDKWHSNNSSPQHTAVAPRYIASAPPTSLPPRDSSAISSLFLPLQRLLL